jgi:hypothetical protein
MEPVSRRSRQRDHGRRDRGGIEEVWSEGMCSAGDTVPELLECGIFVAVFACVCLLAWALVHIMSAIAHRRSVRNNLFTVTMSLSWSSSSSPSSSLGRWSLAHGASHGAFTLSHAATPLVSLHYLPGTGHRRPQLCSSSVARFQHCSPGGPHSRHCLPGTSRSRHCLPGVAHSRHCVTRSRQCSAGVASSGIAFFLFILA